MVTAGKRGHGGKGEQDWLGIILTSLLEIILIEFYEITVNKY